MTMTVFGDMTANQALHMIPEFLKRGEPNLVFELFGQAKPLPANSSDTAVFRKYNALPATVKTMTEGVTPAASSLTRTDVTVALTQMGDGINITDRVTDLVRDNVLKEATEVLGDQAPQMIEKFRFSKLIAGTNYLRAGSVAARNLIVAPYDKTMQRVAVRSLKRQLAKPITRVVRSTTNFDTKNVPASYVAVAHPDLETNITSMAGFKRVEDYGQLSPYNGEIGSCDGVRYILTTSCTAWADAGGTKGTNISTTGTNADVYPVLFFGQDAYAVIALKGAFAVTPMVVNPKPSDSDAWAQRGWVTWKTYTGCEILNQAWMFRVECTATE